MVGRSQARAPLPARHVAVHPPKKSVRASLALCTVRARTTAIAAPTRRAPARGAPGLSAAGKVPGDARSASRRLARARPPGRGERPATSTPGSGAVPAAGPILFKRPASAAAVGAVLACSGAPRRHERRAGLQAGGPRPDVARRHSHAVRRLPSRRAANGMGLSLGARSNFFLRVLSFADGEALWQEVVNGESLFLPSIPCPRDGLYGCIIGMASVLVCRCL
jgi:hypothetical protein